MLTGTQLMYPFQAWLMIREIDCVQLLPATTTTPAKESVDDVPGGVGGTDERNQRLHT
jgi:hypothetical protein